MASARETTIKEEVRQAYGRGEGGYGTLARRFGLSVSTIKAYLGRNSPATYRRLDERRCRVKVRYNTSAAAEEAIKLLNSQREPEPLKAYQCQVCGGWHFGHLPDEVYARRMAEAAHGK